MPANCCLRYINIGNAFKISIRMFDMAVAVVPFNYSFHILCFNTSKNTC
jgi:hypothetical protein